MRQFAAPPEFDLWDNPVTAAASRFDSLADDSLSMEADLLHNASNASLICDDGHVLVDVGVTRSKRPWLLYDYHSLTDFNGDDRYTTFCVLRTAQFVDGDTLSLTLGYQWLGDRTISRLDFERDDNWITSNILTSDHWRILHAYDRPKCG